ncbi:hypothetical protein J891_1264 [Acinetobacter baumannii 44327_8]|nr:hypothetical protein J543_0282 [Acinetobacter baumannii 1159076]EXB09708.1 hypothetical protein J513_2945 [Acinetobacter baumannii 1397084]EXB20063.1 hypothetical protein J535_1585 [Acinetobacter baumannii 1429530]EXB43670.1 hypothetical protein J544_0518 [Acinetobacter baumannii 1461963]EXB59843.1 hypothetical protein J548_1253 [Acinetobacter baumannii 1465485]EXC13054.1 hypothetical protein J509_1904 [Acinetobacter baumannii 647609]EXC75819.1 hypothetical protein J473_1046 [Acinetobacter
MTHLNGLKNLNMPDLIERNTCSIQVSLSLVALIVKSIT